MTTLTRKQRDILRQLVRKDGQRMAALGAGSHSGNVLENMLGKDLITIRDGKVFTTAEGREALTPRRKATKYTVLTKFLREHYRYQVVEDGDVAVTFDVKTCTFRLTAEEADVPVTTRYVGIVEQGDPRCTDPDHIEIHQHDSLTQLYGTLESALDSLVECAAGDVDVDVAIVYDFLRDRQVGVSIERRHVITEAR